MRGTGNVTSCVHLIVTSRQLPIRRIGILSTTALVMFEWRGRVRFVTARRGTSASALRRHITEIDQMDDVCATGRPADAPAPMRRVAVTVLSRCWPSCPRSEHQ